MAWCHDAIDILDSNGLLRFQGDRISSVVSNDSIYICACVWMIATRLCRRLPFEGARWASGMRHGSISAGETSAHSFIWFRMHSHHYIEHGNAEEGVCRLGALLNLPVCMYDHSQVCEIGKRGSRA